MPGSRVVKKGGNFPVFLGSLYFADKLQTSVAIVGENRDFWLNHLKTGGRKVERFTLYFSCFRGVLKQYSTLPRVQSIIGLMTSSFILPIAALSVFPHQEARFLIPVTLPLTFLYTQRIRNIEDASSAITSRIQSTGHKVFMKREAKVPDIKDGLLIVW